MTIKFLVFVMFACKFAENLNLGKRVLPPENLISLHLFVAFFQEAHFPKELNRNHFLMKLGLFFHKVL